MGSRCSRPRHCHKPRWLAKSDSDLKRLSRVCDSAVAGNPPNRVGGTPREGLAGLVRARARRGPSSRQKKIVSWVID